MTWVRWGDTSANHPIVLSVLEHDDCDDRLVNEVHGFVSRCAAQAGSHLTDYVITRGTAVLMAGASRVDILLAVAVFAGYMTDVMVDDRPAYKLVDDDPEFLHLRLKEEVEFERQRRRDNSNPSLIVPVRLRDGDACRWCGRIVDWGSRKAARSGTYDHLIAGQAATIETYVVCCTGCNSSRKDGSRPRNIDKLLAPPEIPYYGPKTIEWLEGNEWRKRQGLPVPPRPRTRVNPGSLAPGITPPATTGASAGDRPDTQSGNGAPPSLDTATAARPVSPAPRPGNQPENAMPQPRPEHHSEHAENQHRPARTPVLPETSRKSADSADGEGTESVSTGRVGSGRVGSGRVGNPSDRDVGLDRSPLRKSSRGRRRRRPRNARTRTGGADA